MPQPETDDDRAKRLLLKAFEVATRIREEHVNEVVREFHGLDWHEMRDLALLACGCIPINRPYRDIVWWDDGPDGTELPRRPPRRRQTDGRPRCGTRDALREHKRRGELIDLQCEMAERRRKGGRSELRAVA